MTRVNLLPPEVRQARRGRAIAHGVRFAALCALFLLVGIYGVRSLQVFLLRGQLRDLQSQQVAVQAQVDALAQVRDTRDAVVAVEGLTRQLLQGEISWSEQLLEVARVVPSGFTLTSLTAQASQGSTDVVATISFSATSAQMLPTEAWLVRIASQEGWANAWVSSVSADGGNFTSTGSFDLTRDAITARGGGPS